MKKIQDTLERVIAPFSTKLGNNICISSLTSGMMMTVPFTIAGSLCTVLNSIPITPWENFLVKSGISPILSIINTCTVGMMALIASFTIAYSYANLKQEDAKSCGILSLIAFVMLLPLEVVVDGTRVSAIPFTNLGGRGLFVAIFVALITGFIFVTVKKRGWVIKMPESVPQNISAVFSSVIPIVLVVFVMFVLRYMMNLSEYGDLNTFVYTMIQKPLMTIMSNAFSSIFLTLFNSLLWFFGVHSMAVNQLVSPALKALDLENLALVESGLQATNITTWSFFMMTAKLGGTGCTLGITVYLAFFSKSKQYRTLGKLALPAVCFNVNEPLIFGLPIMLNPLLIIPFILTPLVAYGLAYIVTIIGIVSPVMGLQLPVEMPVIIAGFLQGGIPFALLQVVIAFLSFVIYYPFINIMDKKAFQEENKTIVSLDS